MAAPDELPYRVADPPFAAISARIALTSPARVNGGLPPLSPRPGRS
jgi:hypothetical protein